LIAEQGRAERQNQSRDAGPTLDLSGNVANAAASRATTLTSDTRDRGQSFSLENRAGRSAETNEAAKRAPAKETSPDDDHSL
jgi:hypothetical protein